jgi:hypothetical protein
MPRKSKNGVKPEVENVEEVSSLPHFYKGYDMRWLKKETQHPDYYLVKEYEEKFGEIK